MTILFRSLCIRPEVLRLFFFDRYTSDSEILRLLFPVHYASDLEYFNYSSRITTHPIRNTLTTLFGSLHTQSGTLRLFFPDRYTLDPKHFNYSFWFTTRLIRSTLVILFKSLATLTIWGTSITLLGSLHTRSGVLRLLFSSHYTFDSRHFGYSFQITIYLI